MFNCSGGLPISVFLKMLFNTGQYSVTVGIFNNQKLIINLRFELSSCSKLSNNLPKHDPNYISLSFYIFLSAFLFSKGYVSKISTKLYISIFLLFNILLGVLLWLCHCLAISGNVCQFVTGSSVAYRSMTIPSYFFRRHIYRFTYLILFVPQKHKLILLFPWWWQFGNSWL